MRAAACVIARQRPGTAKGFIFLSMEDETGIANVIVTPNLYDHDRCWSRVANFCWSRPDLCTCLLRHDEGTGTETRHSPSAKHSSMNMTAGITVTAVISIARSRSKTACLVDDQDAEPDYHNRSHAMP